METLIIFRCQYETYSILSIVVLICMTENIFPLFEGVTGVGL